MAEALTARGVSVTVLTLSPDGLLYERGYPFPVVRIPRRSLGVRRTVQVIARIARLARHHDLLFAPGLPVEAALAAALVGKPYVLKVVGDLAWERAVVQGRTSDDIETFQSRRYGPWTEAHRWSQRWAARRAARVVVPSAYLRRIVRGWGVAERKIEVIPNIAPTGTGSAPVRGANARTGTDGSQRFKVVTVARLVPWKGVEQVIRGLAAMDGVELFIVGDGPDRSRLEALAGAHQCHARFLGQVPRREVLAILRTADIFVLNSAYEGHPHVVLEAMAFGVPVVARAAGGTPELVQDRETGLLLQSGTASEIAAAVSEILQDPDLRERLGQAGQASVAAFSLECIADRTWQVLADVLAASQGGGSRVQHGGGDECRTMDSNRLGRRSEGSRW